MPKPRAVVSWSGGKDCCLALHRARDEFDIVGLVTVLTEDGSRSRSHGLRPEVLQCQADALGLPLLTTNATWKDYEQQFKTLLARAKNWGISHVIFGDVFPDSHKQWAESVCGSVGLTAVEPLWSESTYSLAREFIGIGGRATVITVREGQLGPEWLGRPLTVDALDQFRLSQIDPAGENGEFHTLVTWFPGFTSEIVLQKTAILEHGGCFLLDLEADLNVDRDSPSAVNGGVNGGVK